MGTQKRSTTAEDPPREAQDDAELFREAIGPVRKLDAPAPLPAPPRPRPSRRMAEQDDAEVLGEFARLFRGDRIEVGDALAYRRDEVPARVLQRLRRGAYAVQDELDLHGLNAPAAEAALRAFLHAARRDGAACVRIVHGKGMGSGTDVPVLKNLTDRILRHRSDVLAFHSAPSAQGGHGAVLVLLRRA